MTAERQSPVGHAADAEPSRGPAMRVLLVPGLFYLRWTMVPLRQTLRRHGFDAEIWNAESATVPLEHNIEQLVSDISALASDGRPIGLVTYSFGDWIGRAALHQLAPGVVERMVSLAPVMTTSYAARLAKPLLGRWWPAFSPLCDPQHARRGMPLPAGVLRLILWGRLDLLVTRVAIEPSGSEREMALWATHTSILIQPAAHRAARSFLTRSNPLSL